MPFLAGFTGFDVSTRGDGDVEPEKLLFRVVEKYRGDEIKNVILRKVGICFVEGLHSYFLSSSVQEREFCLFACSQEKELCFVRPKISMVVGCYLLRC